jgi:hypothetical protein
MQAGQNGRLHRGHDLTGLRADHREAENAVVTRVDKRLHEALCFIDRLCPQHGARRHLRHTHRNALALRFAFAQPNPRERRVREHAVGNQPAARGAVPAGQIVPNDTKVVEGDVRELRAAGAFADRPDRGRARLQPFVDHDIATTVQRDTGHIEPGPGGVGSAPRGDQDIAALDGPLTRGRAHEKADIFARSPLHAERLGGHENFDAFVVKDPPYFIRDVHILMFSEPSSMLDDRHAAAEATIGLRQFETDIAAAEHDQMRRQIVELQSLDIGERFGSLEAGNVRKRRVRSEIEENAVAGQHARSAIIKAHFECFRRQETPAPHDQFSAARLVVLQVHGDQALDHGALALADFGHVDRDGTRHRAEPRGVACQIGDFRTPDLVLAGEAVDVGAGSADPSALHHGRTLPGFRHVPGQVLAALSTAEDEGFEPFRLRHGYLQGQVAISLVADGEALPAIGAGRVRWEGVHISGRRWLRSMPRRLP